jgi:PilZ domain
MAIAVLHESTVTEVEVNDTVPKESFSKDRRAESRLSAEDASWLRRARLKYGSEVRVVDVSAGGILVESAGAPLAPQSNVVFELSGQAGTTLAPARVVRSHPVDGNRYQAACAFKRPLSINALAAITREQSSEPATERAPAAAASTRASWQRVVARLRNGSVVRGYTSDFHPTKSHLHLTTEDKPGETVYVALSQLKAIFFVREFAGDPNRVDRTDFAAGQHGRKVEVAFEDGEVLRGTTLAYRSDGNGFFVQPADAASNNLRVFVAPGATLHVRFL